MPDSRQESLSTHYARIKRFLMDVKIKIGRGFGEDLLRREAIIQTVNATTLQFHLLLQRFIALVTMQRLFYACILQFFLSALWDLVIVNRVVVS